MEPEFIEVGRIIDNVSHEGYLEALRDEVGDAFHLNRIDDEYVNVVKGTVDQVIEIPIAHVERLIEILRDLK